jgi:hypothetical protein
LLLCPILFFSVGSALQFHAESELLCTQKFAALEPVFFFFFFGWTGWGLCTIVRAFCVGSSYLLKH